MPEHSTVETKFVHYKNLPYASSGNSNSAPDLLTLLCDWSVRDKEIFFLNILNPNVYQDEPWTYMKTTAPTIKFERFFYFKKIPIRDFFETYFWNFSS